MLAPGRYRGAHNQSSVHRVGENLLPECGDWRQFNHVRNRQGVQRTIRRGRVSQEAGRFRHNPRRWLGAG